MSGRTTTHDGDPCYPEDFDAPTAVDFVPDDPPGFERGLDAAMCAGEGRYTEEDRELVAAALAHSELPSQVSERELPGLALEWLEAAVGARGVTDGAVIVLLDRMTREGTRAAQRMALRALQRLAALTLAAQAQRGSS